MSARSSILTPRAILSLAALMTATTGLVTACTPVINIALQAIAPGSKPVPVLPVSETPTDTIHAAPAAEAPAERESLASRDLPKG